MTYVNSWTQIKPDNVSGLIGVCVCVGGGQSYFFLLHRL